VPFALSPLLTPRGASRLNAYGVSLGLQHWSILYDENYASLATDVVFRVLGPLSRASKQRRDCLLHASKEERTGGRSHSQTNAHGRQEGKDGRGSHAGQTKRSVLRVYGRCVGRDGSR
jgi:hypothetical protein